eukprot:697673-Pyramimonas_sp.AAC.1
MQLFTLRPQACAWYHADATEMCHLPDGSPGAGEGEVALPGLQGGEERTEGEARGSGCDDQEGARGEGAVR